MEISALTEKTTAAEKHQAEASGIIHNLTEDLHEKEKEIEALRNAGSDELETLKRHNKQLMEEVAQKTEKYGANVADLNEQITALTAMTERERVFYFNLRALLPILKFFPW